MTCCGGQVPFPSSSADCCCAEPQVHIDVDWGSDCDVSACYTPPPFAVECHVRGCVHRNEQDETCGIVQDETCGIVLSVRGVVLGHDGRCKNMQFEPTQHIHRRTLKQQARRRILKGVA